MSIGGSTKSLGLGAVCQELMSNTAAGAGGQPYCHAHSESAPEPHHSISTVYYAWDTTGSYFLHKQYRIPVLQTPASSVFKTLS